MNSVVSRHILRASTRIVGSRWLSEAANVGGDNPSVQKLRAVLEEYRVTNYSQEIPTRFIKEILSAADANKDGFLSKQEVSDFLGKIGAGEKLSSAELDEVMEYAMEKGQQEVSVQNVKSMLVGVVGKK